MNTQSESHSYLKTRLDAFGISEEQNLFVLPDGAVTECFTEDEAGNILIHYFMPDGRRYSYHPPGRKYPKHFMRTRLARPNGDQRYNQEKGSPSFVYFPPLVIKKCQGSENIHTLVIVEGEFKAFVAAVHGIAAVCIASIHNFFETGKSRKGEQKFLDPDLKLLIERCKVKNIVLLHDADARLVKPSDPWDEEKDLAKRARSFFNSVYDFRRTFPSEPGVNIFYLHIRREFFFQEAKGLDDLLARFTSRIEAIKSDLSNLHLAETFFHGWDITDNSQLGKLKLAFGISSPEDFYELHKESIGENSFTFNSEKYRLDETGKLQRLKRTLPYMRVGIQYFKIIDSPQVDGSTLTTYKLWSASAIKTDHKGLDLSKIEQFEDFCFLPSHKNFRLVIEVGDNRFLNRYYPLPWEPVAGECPYSLKFITHIFGDQVELGLDYLKLLYLEPTQILPILCLVSEERKTGKTTFLNWLTKMFGRNATINRNEDFESNFNSSWAGKLIICIDETFIDRRKVYERLKSLSTGRVLKVEAKGQDSFDAEFFGKLILCSNNEDSFIPVDASEIRFWIRKLNSFGDEDPDFYDHLVKEIPAFFYYLDKREYSTSKKTRMWFTPEQIRTEALSRIVSENKPFVEKELCAYLEDAFGEFEKADQLSYTLSDLRTILTERNVREPNFRIKHLLLKKFHIEPTNPKEYLLQRLLTDGTQLSEKRKGRVFVFKRSDFIKSEQPVALLQSDVLPF
jgi:hypothetical protein